MHCEASKIHWRVIPALVLFMGCNGPMGQGGDMYAAGDMVEGGDLAPVVLRMRLGTDPVAFERGRKLFEHKFTVAEGLGPNYNGTSCASCHAIPGVGGQGDRDHRSAVEDGRFRYVMGQEQMFAADQAFRLGPPLYGVGYFDDLTEDALRSGCGVDAALGIAGVVGLTEDGLHVKRAGRKVPAYTFAGFVCGALYFEMGISTTACPNETSSDGGPDELPLAQVQDLITFVLGLDTPPAPPEESVGRTIFQDAGCAVCHRLDRHGSDMCLHDLGLALADPGQATGGTTQQWRTAPLIGLRYRTLLMHDGRSTTVDEAVRLHAGEATKVLRRYQALAAADQAALLKFVGSL